MKANTKAYVIGALSIMFMGISNADDLIAVCEGCSDSDFQALATEIAGEQGTYANYVQVADFQNGVLKKYFVITNEDLEDAPWPPPGISEVTPDPDEIQLFNDASLKANDIYVYLESCGPGAVGDWLIPDLGVSSACDTHDACYSIGGTPDNRRTCDGQLRDDIDSLGHPYLAVIYYYGVRAGGWLAFNYSSGGAHPWDSRSVCRTNFCDVIVVNDGS